MSNGQKIFEKFFVVNIEATCWEKFSDKPPIDKNEIIAIGVVPLNIRTLKTEEHTEIIVKPVSSKISPFCEKETGLNQITVDDGILFKDACEKLIKLKTRTLPFLTWGDYDRRQFRWQCSDSKADYPFGSHWEFRGMFALMMGLDRDIPLRQALELLKLEPRDTGKKFIDDAYNIANVVIETYRRIRNEKENK